MDFSRETLAQLLPIAAAVALLALTEAVSIARAVAVKSGQRIDGNQEFIGQGLSNLAGTFFSGYTSSGSFNRTGLNYASGARTPLAAVCSAGFLSLIVMFLAPLASYLPTAATAVRAAARSGWVFGRQAWRTQALSSSARSKVNWVATGGGITHSECFERDCLDGEPGMHPASGTAENLSANHGAAAELPVLQAARHGVDQQRADGTFDQATGDEDQGAQCGLRLAELGDQRQSDHAEDVDGDRAPRAEATPGCVNSHVSSSARSVHEALHAADGQPRQGVPRPLGPGHSRNLAPHETDLKGWSDAEITRAIRSGVRKDGQPLKPPMASTGTRKNINEADMSALIAYLRSLKLLPTAAK